MVLPLEVSRMHVVVIGAGIAGLAAAWRLAVRGVRKITVLEREALPFSHSSARNAAIFRPLETDEAIVRLVTLSTELMQELCTEPLVRHSGLLLTAQRAATLDQLHDVARRERVPHEILAQQALYARYPELEGGRSTSAVWLPHGGVIDIHRVCEALRASLRSNHVEVRLNTSVERIVTHANGVEAVVTGTGETLRCDAVVVAAGAWAQELGFGVGAPLALTPHRRHLALLLKTGGAKLSAFRPVVWDMETGVYFRPESGGVLACPGDHEPVAAGVPHVSEAALERLAQGLPELCPELESYALVRSWACLRTMSADRSMVIGPDPRCAGLFWFAGLGGQGMSAGLGGADVLSRLVTGGTHDNFHPRFSVEHHARLRAEVTQ